MWGPATQVTTSPDSGSRANVIPRWGEAGTFEIHHVYKGCLTQKCNGEGAVGFYLHVDSTGWAAAGAAAYQFTGEQPSGETLRAQDIDMEVDSNNDVHVVFEVFRHDGIPDSVTTAPLVGYKHQGERSWDADTAIVVTDTTVAGRCVQKRRDHGPQLFIQRGSPDTLHLAWPSDRQICDPVDSTWTCYTRKAVNGDDAGWEKETFMTKAFAKVEKVWGDLTHVGAGPTTIIVDSTGMVHLWGRQYSEGYWGSQVCLPPARPDTVRWRHFWGTPPTSGLYWNDNWRTVFEETVATTCPVEEAASSSESGGTGHPGEMVEWNGKLYFTYTELGGPAWIDPVTLSADYSDSVNTAKQITPSGVQMGADALFRTNNGVWHYWTVTRDLVPGRMRRRGFR
jgi:hypothetical protein